MEKTIDGNKLERGEEAEMIAKTLIEKYPGKLISKGGIKKIFQLPNVRASEINKYLDIDYGFRTEGRNFRIPTQLLVLNNPNDQKPAE